jgi:hypothetical protein
MIVIKNSCTGNTTKSFITTCLLNVELPAWLITKILKKYQKQRENFYSAFFLNYLCFIFIMENLTWPRLPVVNLLEEKKHVQMVE